MAKFISNINNPYTEKATISQSDKVFEDGRKFVCDSHIKLKRLFRYYSSNITNKKMTFLL